MLETLLGNRMCMHVGNGRVSLGGEHLPSRLEIRNIDIVIYYTTILLGFLVHTCIIFSKSSSDRFFGDSIAIFIK